MATDPASKSDELDWIAGTSMEQTIQKLDCIADHRSQKTCYGDITANEEVESSSSNRYASISSLAHFMVQERLDQMIREGQQQEVRRGKTRKVRRRTNSRFILMVAMEKCSCDPREDFRQSMIEMIIENRIEEPKDLRYLLNCYVKMNAEEYKVIILEVFHEVCTNLFF
ncbi:hypothetical protein Ancab_004834 [Ancistrocladus abbreviatus]